MERLDRLTRPEGVAGGGHHGVGALAVCLDHPVAGIVDDVGVVADPADHRIGAPAAFEDVVAGIPGDRVGEGRPFHVLDPDDHIGQPEGEGLRRRVVGAQPGHEAEERAVGHRIDRAAVLGHQADEGFDVVRGGVAAVVLPPQQQQETVTPAPEAP